MPTEHVSTAPDDARALHPRSLTDGPAVQPGLPLPGPALARVTRALLARPGGQARGNSPVRAATFHHLQHTHGNRAVQRLVDGSGSGPSAPPVPIQRAPDDGEGSWWDKAVKTVTGSGTNAIDHPVDALDSAAGRAMNVTTFGAPAILSSLFGASKGQEEKGSLFDQGIDWLESKEKSGTKWLADKAEGIPVLEQVAHAGEAAVDFQTEVTGGALKGAGGLLGGVGHMMEHPLQTLQGLETMAEHIEPLPGVANPLKILHGAYNVASGQEGLGDMPPPR